MFGNTAQVDRNKDLVAPGREMTQKAGHQILARTILTRDQDVGIRIGQLQYRIPNPKDGRRVADQLRQVVTSQGVHPFPQATNLFSRMTQLDG